MSADIDPLAQVAMGHRVEGVAEADVVIGMDRHLRPARRIEAGAAQRLEGRALDGLEDLERPPACGAVDAAPRRLHAPAADLALGVIAVEEGLAAEEALAHIGDLALDVGFAGGHDRRRGVDDEAAMPAVLLEDATEDRVVAIGLADRGPHGIEDDPRGHTAEERPGVLEAAPIPVWPLSQARSVSRCAQSRSSASLGGRFRDPGRSCARMRAARGSPGSPSSGWQPSCFAASRYRVTVLRVRPVVRAIARRLSPRCARRSTSRTFHMPCSL